MRFIVSASLVTALGCGAPSPRPAAVVAPVADPEAVDVTAPVAATDAEPVPVAAPVLPAACATPCLLLGDHVLADYTSAYAATCSGAALEVIGEPDYLRNCIYAASGYAFKSKRWQYEFRDLPWYQVRADWADADLSAVAVTNVRELKRQAAAEAAAAKPSRADLAALTTWLAGARKGRSAAPVWLDGEAPLAARELPEHVTRMSPKKATIDHDAVFGDRIAAQFPGKSLRVIEATWTTAAWEYDDGDGGSEDVLALYFDGDTLVAVDITMFE